MSNPFISLWQPPTVEDIAHRWKSNQTAHFRKESELVYQALLKAKSLDEADEIIGYTVWTHYICDGCNQRHRKIVLIGQESQLGYCENCIREMMEILNPLPTPPSIQPHSYHIDPEYLKAILEERDDD